jgi:hypothetical protein
MSGRREDAKKKGLTTRRGEWEIRELIWVQSARGIEGTERRLRRVVRENSLDPWRDVVAQGKPVVA